MEQKNRRISTRQLVSMAMLGAISIVLVAVIHFPLIPAIIPFNVLKAGINGVITFFLYKSISHLMKGN